jgi:hypothetical protein
MEALDQYFDHTRCPRFIDLAEHSCECLRLADQLATVVRSSILCFV